MKRKLKQSIALFSTIALLMTPGIVWANDPGQGTGGSNGGGSGATEKITITLNKGQLELTEGTSETLVATVTNTDDTNVTWSSSDKSIAVVDSTTGQVTALSPGKATITAKANVGDYFAQCEVTVIPEDIKITSLNLTVGTLDKPFNSNNTDYTITIPANVGTINLSEAITLNVDKSKVDLKVTGDSGLVTGSVIKVLINNVERYKFTIIKEEPVDLSLKLLRVDDYTLDQAFSPDLLNYTLTVPYEVESITVQAAAASSEASVSVSGATALEVGDSIVTVTVSDNDGNKREYKITVTRESESSEEEEENIVSTSSSTSHVTKPDSHEDSREDRTLQYVLVSIGCLILFLIGGFGIYFYIKTSKKNKNNKNKDKKENTETSSKENEQSTVDTANSSSVAEEKEKTNVAVEDKTISDVVTDEVDDSQKERLNDLEQTKEFYLNKEIVQEEQKKKDDVLKDIEELFDDD